MATDFLYLRPDDNLAYGGAVTGSTDADYPPEWLTDGRHGFPVRGPGGGSLSLTVALASGTVDLVVASHTNCDAAIALSGSVNGTIAADADVDLDEIPRNGFFYGSAVSAGSLTVSVSGNSKVPVIGELFAGQARTLRRFLLSDEEHEHVDFAGDARGLIRSSLPYANGGDAYTVRGAQLYTTAELDDLIKWRRAQRHGSRLSVLIKDPAVNEALIVNFRALQWRPSGAPSRPWLVDMVFEEYPRGLW